MYIHDLIAPLICCYPTVASFLALATALHEQFLP